MRTNTQEKTPVPNVPRSHLPFAPSFLFQDTLLKKLWSCKQKGDKEISFLLLTAALNYSFIFGLYFPFDLFPFHVSSRKLVRKKLQICWELHILSFNMHCLSVQFFTIP